LFETVVKRVRGFRAKARRAAKRSPALTDAYRRATALYHGLRLRGVVNPRAGGVDAAGMVWIFGSGRSGSTWLRRMMAEMPAHRVWEEPMVGALFGEFYARAPGENLRSKDYVMGEPIRCGWIQSVRNFVLDGARYSNPDLKTGEYLIVKEPNGSVGAPLLMEALPEARMVLLVRDPRDVVASVLDAARKGGWLYESRDEAAGKRREAADRKPTAFVRERANAYRRGVESAGRAYDAHRGRKVLIRYEDLRADTLGTMKRLYSALGIPAGEEELRRAVEKHSWENIPTEDKGEGKSHRKATPGGWRDDLTPSQARVVEKITAPLLDRFYPARDPADT